MIGARHGRRGVQRAEDRGAGDLLGRRHPSQRMLGADLRAAGTGEEPGRHLRLDPPGSDAVDEDAPGGQGLGERLAERVESRLAGPVGGRLGLAAERAPRGDVDDPSATGSGHRLRREEAQVRGPVEVRGEDMAPSRAPLLVAGGHRGMLLVYRRVVDDHLDGAEAAGGRLPKAPHLVAVRHVRREDGVPGARQGGQDRLGRGPVLAVVDGDAHAARRELERDLAADPARRTRDQCRELSHVRSSCS